MLGGWGVPPWPEKLPSSDLGPRAIKGGKPALPVRQESDFLLDTWTPGHPDTQTGSRTVGQVVEGGPSTEPED